MASDGVTGVAFLGGLPRLFAAGVLPVTSVVPSTDFFEGLPRFFFAGCSSASSTFLGGLPRFLVVAAGCEGRLVGALGLTFGCTSTAPLSSPPWFTASCNKRKRLFIQLNRWRKTVAISGCFSSKDGMASCKALLDSRIPMFRSCIFDILVAAIASSEVLCHISKFVIFTRSEKKSIHLSFLNSSSFPWPTQSLTVACPKTREQMLVSRGTLSRGILSRGTLSEGRSPHSHVPPPMLRRACRRVEACPPVSK